MQVLLKAFDLIFLLLFVGLIVRYSREASSFVATTEHSTSELLSVVSLQGMNAQPTVGVSVAQR